MTTYTVLVAAVLVPVCVSLLLAVARATGGRPVGPDPWVRQR